MMTTDRYDSPWKDAIETFFVQFMALFFPAIHADIDWSRGYEFLDTELQQIMGDAEIGKRLADKLVKVWLRSGEEMWLLIHIEVQGYPEDGFPVRMYVYNYRTYDRYGCKVISLAVLTDEHPAWRPNTYISEAWDFRLAFTFPIVKLLDYRKRWAELEQSRNPFALVVMAHLKTQETRKDANHRRLWKLTLLKLLYQRGYTRSDIHKLFITIDWLMKLPKEQAKLFWQEFHAYEEKHNMTYVTSVEQLGIEKGMELGIEKGMELGIRQGREQGREEGREQGIRQGREQGREEGREQGREEGQRLGLLDGIALALELRYGANHPLLPRVLEELHALTSVEHLKAVQQAIRTAPTLEELRASIADAR